MVLRKGGGVESPGSVLVDGCGRGREGEGGHVIRGEGGSRSGERRFGLI